MMQTFLFCVVIICFNLDMRNHIFLHLDRFRYVHVKDEYPQGYYVGTRCPSHYRYQRHVCGKGASTWRGNGNVEFGPFSSNLALSPGDHCYEDCDCREVTVECGLALGTTS